MDHCCNNHHHHHSHEHLQNPLVGILAALHSVYETEDLQEKQQRKKEYYQLQKNFPKDFDIWTTQVIIEMQHDPDHLKLTEQEQEKSLETYLFMSSLSAAATLIGLNPVSYIEDLLAHEQDVEANPADWSPEGYLARLEKDGLPAEKVTVHYRNLMKLAQEGNAELLDA